MRNILLGVQGSALSITRAIAPRLFFFDVLIYQRLSLGAVPGCAHVTVRCHTKKSAISDCVMHLSHPVYRFSYTRKHTYTKSFLGTKRPGSLQRDDRGFLLCGNHWKNSVSLSAERGAIRQGDWAQKNAPRARENSVWWGMDYEYFRK
jgi:hypothetical protein